MTDPDRLRERATSIFRQLRDKAHDSGTEGRTPRRDAEHDDAAPPVRFGTGGDGGQTSEPDEHPPDPAPGEENSLPRSAEDDADEGGSPPSADAEDHTPPRGMAPAQAGRDERGTRAGTDPAGQPLAGDSPRADGGDRDRNGQLPTITLGAQEMAALSPLADPTVASGDGAGGGGDGQAGPEAAPAPAGTAGEDVGPRRDLPRILAIANQKGGVGKTTTAVNLGAGLAELGYRVLVIDLDPQGNATTGLGVNPRNLDSSIYDVILHDVPVEDCIEPSSVRNLFVVPATIDLAGAEIELVPVFSRELRLRRALEPIQADFDYLLIDCPPSLGLLTVNGLAASTEVVVPIQCEYYALEGLGQLLRNVNLVRTNLNPRLEVSTIVLTMFDARTRLAEQVVDEVRSHFGDRVCRNVVPRTVRLSEAPSFGQPITVFDSSSRGAIAYRELAKEVSGGAPQRVG